MRRTHARVALAVVMALVARPSQGRADAPAPPPAPALNETEILGTPDEGIHVQSLMTRVTAFDQFGHGYQAQGAAAPDSPGSERLTVFEPQVEIEATQGDRWRHTVRVPVDVVTNASADAIDVLSSASRHVEAGSIDWAADYKVDGATDATLLGGVHLENPFRSWHGGLAGKRSFANGATVVSASVLEVFDWFDRFDIDGSRHGRTDRAGTTGSVGFTQILTPTTLLNVNYGFTLQLGELGNTWNSVPLSGQERGAEILPQERARHALVARLAQYLPWDGALHLYYRFYADDWGIAAHTVEAELLQRLSRFVYVGGHYRFHTQNGVYFFTTLADPDTSTLRTADSDLATLQAQTIGGKIVIDTPGAGGLRGLHFEVGFDRYVRTNDLQINVVTCATGYRF
jgi:hypothetical protein